MSKEVIADMSAHMDKTIESLRREYQKVRTGRASTGILEEIKVDYYGTPSPLSAVATLAVPEPRTITLQPWETKMIPIIEKAIMNANLGMTPANDGKLIRLNIPRLTEERRRDLVKLVSRRVEEARVSVRNLRRDALNDMKEFEKEKMISEDDFFMGKEEVQKLTDEFIVKIDDIGKRKEEEVMEV